MAAASRGLISRLRALVIAPNPCSTTAARATSIAGFRFFSSDSAALADEKEGIFALQVGCGQKKANHLTKPEVGHFSAQGQYVDVTGITKGKGFQGPFQLSSMIPPAFKTLGNPFASSATSLVRGHVLSSSRLPSSLALQVREFSAKSKEKKWKKLTPITSKVKKIKMKHYSSYKGRFRCLRDGTIRRWREGKRHNAHLKSKEAKRRLRRHSTVPVAYAKVMKKLNFTAT